MEHSSNDIGCMENGGLSVAQPSVDVKKDNVCGATSMSGEKYTDCTVCGDRCVEGMMCTNCTELEVSKCVCSTNPRARMT